MTELEQLREAVAELQDENARLKERLAPFAEVAEGIPAEWPGQCHLRIDYRRDGSEFFSYHGTTEPHSLLPTLRQWRDALL